MQDFNDWQAIKGQKTIKITPREMVDIWVSCSKPVQVFGVREKEAIPLKTGTEFRFREKLFDFEKILIVGTGQTRFGLRVHNRPLQNGEYNSGEKAPVISLPEPGNLLVQMRRMSRAHHEANRMPVLEPEEHSGFTSYEYDEDQEVLFEEEAYELAMKTKKEAAQKAKTQSEKAKQKSTSEENQNSAEGDEQEQTPDAKPEPPQQLAAE